MQFSPGALCPSCRRPVFGESRYCTWCGTGIGELEPMDGAETRAEALEAAPRSEKLACASCHRPGLRDEAFCAECGAPHASEEVHALDSWATIGERVRIASHGRYEGVRVLGRGGMGIVLQARDRELDRPVAVKVLSPSWLADERMVDRFQLEARIVAALRHESIVSVYDVGRAGEFYYFVMDFIEGVSLGDILRSHQRLSIQVVSAVLYQVGSALDYAHSRGNSIVHRDVKPSNIMLDVDGHAVVMDFGISKVTGSGTGLTQTGSVLGTPEYMSPEQARGAVATPKSDQYSLGAVAFAMLTGAPPFTGAFFQVLMAHQNEPVPPLLELRSDCPPDLAEGIERMLAKSPAERWESLRDLLHDLDLRPLRLGDPARTEIGGLVRECRVGSAEGNRTEEVTTSRTANSLRIVPRPEDLEPGDSLSLRARMVFANGVEEGGRDVSWESTDPSVVSVDPSSGALVAVGAGTAVVWAVRDELKESLTVTVRPPSVARVVLSPGECDLEERTDVTVRARLLSKRDEVLDRPVHWSSSNNRVASVSEDGVVTGQERGAAVIFAHCEGVGATAQVRVRPGKKALPEAHGVKSRVALIDVEVPSATVQLGETFRAAAIPRDAKGQVLDEAVEWSSENHRILEALDDGQFRCVGVGESGVLAAAGGRVARARLRVVAPPAADDAGHIGKRPDRVEVESRGRRDMKQVAPTHRRPLPSRGVVQRLRSLPWPNLSFHWPSLSFHWPSVSFRWRRHAWAGVAVAVGLLAVMALWSRLSRDVVVREAEVVYSGSSEPLLTLARTDGTPVSDIELGVGQTESLVGVAGDEPVDGAVWTSSDTAVAGVDNEGRVTAASVGMARISMAWQGRDATATVRVEPPERIVAQLLRSNGEALPRADTVEVGRAVEIDAVAADGRGRLIPGVRVEWESQDDAVVRVSASGRAVGLNPGRATLVARAGAAEHSLDVTVARRPAGSLLVRSGTFVEILVDRAKRGEHEPGGEPFRIELPAGRHELTLRSPSPDVPAKDTTVVIPAGGRIEIDAWFERGTWTLEINRGGA